LGYLSFEEQFKPIINNEEMLRIQDKELEEIRVRYWNKRHQLFIDEASIPDWELERRSNELKHLEKIELENYIKRHELNYTLNWD